MSNPLAIEEFRNPQNSRIELFLKPYMRKLPAFHDLYQVVDMLNVPKAHRFKLCFKIRDFAMEIDAKARRTPE